MYSVYCETCSERETAYRYGPANEFFMEHVERKHEVELVNEAHRRHELVASD